MSLTRRGLVAGAAIGPFAPALVGLRDAHAQARTLVMAMSTTPRGFDTDVWVPGQIESAVNIYEGLLRHPLVRRADGTRELDLTRFEPHFAESWTVSSDGLEYVFKLRRDVRSPYGNTLSADDVVWTYQKSDRQRRTGLFMRNVSQIRAVEKVADDQVKFVLTTPNRIFLNVMALHIPAIFDSTEARRHATEDDPFATRWLGMNSAGYGPYHVQEVRQGQQAVFVANPNYVFEAPHFSRIVWREVPSPATRVALVRSGQVQYAEQIPLQQIVELQRDRNVNVETVPGTASATVRMNPRIAPFDDVRVRRAICHATDYQAISSAVFLNQGTRSRSVLAPKIPGYAETYTYETDYERARATGGGWPSERPRPHARVLDQLVVGGGRRAADAGLARARRHPRDAAARPADRDDVPPRGERLVAALLHALGGELRRRPLLQPVPVHPQPRRLERQRQQRPRTR